MTLNNLNIPSEFFSETAVAVFIISPDHKVIFWNKACEKLTGVPSHEILNTKNHWQPFYKEYRPCLVDIIIDGNYSVLPELYVRYGKSKLSPNGINGEGWYENLGGEKRYIIFDAAPVFNSSGEIVAAIETLQDITEAKLDEIEKEKLIYDLENAILNNKALKSFIPICSSCKNIRNKEGVWISLEEYFSEHGNLLFSHGICPHCVQKLYPKFSQKYHESKDSDSEEV